MVRLQRSVIEAVSFLTTAWDDRRKGGGHGSRGGVEVEIDKAGWNPPFGRGGLSPSPVGLSSNVLLVMGTRGSITRLVFESVWGRLTSLRTVG